MKAFRPLHDMRPALLTLHDAFVLLSPKTIKPFYSFMPLLTTFLLRDVILITILEGVLVRILIYCNDLTAAGQ
jgi:hypothetical protein